MVTFDMEKDYLQLAYMLAKVLHRHLILPKFHCYINEPPGCYLDAVFDTYGLAELGYFENSLLRNPLVPSANLQSTKIYLPTMEETGTPTLKQLLKNFESKSESPMIEIVFPKMSQYDGSHLNFISLPDRYTGGMGWKEYAEEIEQKVKFNDELLFAPWYTYWRADLEKVNYTCVVTSELKIDYVRKFLNTLSPSNTLYVVSNNPAFPTPKGLYNIKNEWGPWVVWSYDFLWAGHKLLQGHGVIVQLQMEACAAAEHVVINIWQPVWLIEGICALRREMYNGAKDCIRLTKMQL